MIWEDIDLRICLQISEPQTYWTLHKRRVLPVHSVICDFVTRYDSKVWKLEYFQNVASPKWSLTSFTIPSARSKSRILLWIICLPLIYLIGQNIYRMQNLCYQLINLRSAAQLLISNFWNGIARFRCNPTVYCDLRAWSPMGCPYPLALRKVLQIRPKIFNKVFPNVLFTVFETPNLGWKILVSFSNRSTDNCT